MILHIKYIALAIVPSANMCSLPAERGEAACRGAGGRRMGAWGSKRDTNWLGHALGWEDSEGPRRDNSKGNIIDPFNTTRVYQLISINEEIHVLLII